MIIINFFNICFHIRYNFFINEVSFSYSDSDLNNFVTFDKMNDFNWYVIETLDELTARIEIDIDEHQASNTIPTRLLLLRLSLFKFKITQPL